MLPKDILGLYNSGVTRNLKKGGILSAYNTPDYVYLLQTGALKVSTIINDGSEIIKCILKPGNFFGELSLFETEREQDEIAIAIVDSDICMIPVNILAKSMHNDICIRKLIHRSICRRITNMERRMFSLSAKDVRERVYDFIKEYVSEFGYPISKGFQAKNILTHEDIAKLTATSRQSVTTSLRYFKKKGLIDYDSRSISILSHYE